MIIHRIRRYISHALSVLFLADNSHLSSNPLLEAAQIEIHGPYETPTSYSSRTYYYDVDSDTRFDAQYERAHIMIRRYMLAPLP